MATFRLLPEDPDIGWAPYAWLLYLGMMPMGCYFADIGAASWIATGIAIVVFLPLYFASYWVHGWRRLALATAIAVLAFPLSLYNASASSFLIFAAYFAGSAMERPRDGLLGVLWITALLVVCAIFVQPIIYFWLPGICGVVVIGLLGVQHVARAASIANLRLAREEIDALARIAERERIARDLHDLLGHSLSIIALKSELADRLLTDDPARAKRELVDVQAVAREALAEVRVAVRGYRVGSGAGLQLEIDNAQRALRAAGVALACDTDPVLIAPLLDATREGALALALREAVTNVVRHARASRCEISFFDDGTEYGVVIADDGRGASGRPGHGIAGMRTRIESLGGSFSRAVDRGTRLRLAFTHPVTARDVTGEIAVEVAE
jgi:two-component system, NarL family, sensor histidine kinase DesK